MSIADDLERQMLDLVNEERTSRGLDPLELEQNLNEASEDHSAWMLDANVFSHTGTAGSSAGERMEDAGFDFSGSYAWAENIAYRSVSNPDQYDETVVLLHEALMDSPGHRANILNPDLDYLGVGIEVGEFNGFEAMMVTQNFALTAGEVELDTGTPAPAEEMPVAEAPAPVEQPAPIVPPVMPEVEETPEPVAGPVETPEAPEPVEAPEMPAFEETPAPEETPEPVTAEDETPEPVETPEPTMPEPVETPEPIEAPEETPAPIAMDDETPNAPVEEETPTPVAMDDETPAEEDEPTPVAMDDTPEAPVEEETPVDPVMEDKPIAFDWVCGREDEFAFDLPDVFWAAARLFMTYVEETGFGEDLRDGDDLLGASDSLDDFVDTGVRAADGGRDTCDDLALVSIFDMG
ncbi:CAP domain-containing protein [Pontivivens ytuae]|uniref:CAP domain-containing protein n=1 Tax=Pontivivens ytuae TaxID=2789856 RepID=UPI001E2D2FBD|nr:CAP domain-containing protein [Pontivivens ytuae]